MELIQSSFQASLDASADRLSTAELADLRTMFRYFDTDSDGAVSANQACRMFALLGLDVNPAYVQDLEEVYLNEFVKIVDSHVSAPPPPVATTELIGDNDPLASLAVNPPLVPALQIAAPPTAKQLASKSESVVERSSDQDAQRALEDDAARRRNEELWETEWKLVDTYRRGRVQLDELRLFFASCASMIPARDLQRFMEMFGEPCAATGSTAGAGAGNDDTAFVLPKAGFIKFRREYTAKDVVGSDRGLSSDEEDDENGDNDIRIQELTARGGGGGLEDDAPAVEDVAPSERVDDLNPPRRTYQQQHSDDDVALHSSRSHNSNSSNTVVMDPTVLDDAFDDQDSEDEDEEDSDEEEHEMHDAVHYLPTHLHS